MAPGKVNGPGGPPGSGPSDPAGPIEGPAGGDLDRKKDEAAGVERPGGASGARFADKLGPGASVSGAPGAARADAAGAGTTAELAAELQAGRITPQVAIERVIDRVVAQQLGADAPAPVREKLRAALETAVADDPLLIEKLRTLGA